MTNTILLKRSATPAKIPLTTALSLGELSINTYDGTMFFKKNAGAGDILVPVVTSADSNHAISASGQISMVVQPTHNAVSLVSSSSLTTPPVGTLALYAQSFSNKCQIAQMDSNGRQDPLQRALYTNNIVIWMPNDAAVVAPAFGTSWTARNSGTAAAQARPVIASTNLVTAMTRNTFGTGTTATGASGIQTTNAVAMIGNVANMGGFFMYARFSLETYLASERFFIGLSANNAAMAADSSGWLNSIGVGKDAADTTLQFITHSASAGTKNNTTLTPSATQIYDLYIFVLPNGTQAQLTLMDPNNITTPLAYVVFNSNLPANTTPLYMQAHIQSTVGITAKQLSLSKMYLETDC